MYTYLHAHTCMILHTQVCTDELVHIYVRTSVHTACISTCKYEHLRVKELNGHDTDEVCINIYTVWTGKMQFSVFVCIKNCILGTVERLGGAKLCL